FFFSSRRRHTRSKRDWSSDVCSSDLFIDFDCHLMTADFKPADFWQQVVNGIVEAAPGEDVLRQCGVCAQNSYGSFTLENLFKLRSEERRVGKEGEKHR